MPDSTNPSLGLEPAGTQAPMPIVVNFVTRLHEPYASMGVGGPLLDPRLGTRGLSVDRAPKGRGAVNV